MIARRSYIKRSNKPLARKVRPNPIRKGRTAATRRKMAADWSKQVKAKYPGVKCILLGADWEPCVPPYDAAHAFPKGACPAVRYDPDFGVPLCRRHHEIMGNGSAWRALLMRLWGPALYAKRYVAAHVAGAKRWRELLERT